MFRFSQIAGWARSPVVRERFLAIAPFAVFVLLIWAKLSYFNFPPAERLGTDWVGWKLKEAVQAWASTLAAVLLVTLPVLLLRPIARYATLLVLDLFVTLLVVADVVHFRFYGDIISVSALAVAGQVGGVADSVLELVRVTDVVLGLDLLVGLLILPVYVRACRGAGEVATRSLRPYALRSGVLALLLLLVAPIRIVALDRGDTFRYNYFRLFGVRKIGLLNYHAYEAGKQYVSAFVAGVQVKESDRARALGFVEDWSGEATAPSELFGVAKGKNVIFVMLESFHGFPLGLRIDGQEVTPNLNALAEKSINFTNFYGQTWDGTTSDGEFTSLQSLHPLPSGSVATTYPQHAYRGVPAILKERGYATLSAHAYYGTLWNMQVMHPRLGFEQSLFREKYEINEEIGMGLSDGEFLRQTVPYLDRLPRPFMAYLMTLSSHHPFELPARYATLDVGVMKGTMLGKYLQTVHYTDSALGAFIQQLKDLGMWDETVLVLYGDHRAELGSRDEVERLLTTYGGAREARDGFDADYWREANRLTFMVHLPGDTAAGPRSVSGGHLDIAPTVLNLLGVENHLMVSLGRDLTQGRNEFVVMRNGSFVSGDTVCVTPDAEISRKECRLLGSAAPLDTARLAPRFEAARERLEISDLLLRGDMIPPGGTPAQTVAGTLR